DGEIRNREPRTLGVVRVRDCERHEEAAERRDEHGEPDAEAVDVDRVRQPGIAGPGPPDDAEYQGGPREAPGCWLRADQRGDLRDREDEDEVEEELEVACTPLELLRLLGLVQAGRKLD